MFLKDCCGYGLRTECSEKRVGVGRAFKKLVPQSRRDDDGLDQGGIGRSSEKCSGCGHVLKVDLLEFTIGSNMGYTEKEESWVISRFLC